MQSILGELHQQADSAAFQLQYWPSVSVFVVLLLNMFVRGWKKRFIWSALVAALDLLFLMVLLPQVTERVSFFARLAVNWTYVGLTWFIGCTLAAAVLLLLLLFALLSTTITRRFNYRSIINGKVFLAVMLMSVVVSVVFVFFGCGSYEVVYDKISLTSWHSDKRVRIAYFADAHLGFDDNVQKLAEVCDKIAGERCDIALLGGDFIDDVELRTGAVAQLRKLADKLPLGVYFVSGNGDYVDGRWDKTRKLLLDNHVHVLDNEAVNIGSVQYPLLVAGLEYASRNNDDSYDPVLQKHNLQRLCARLPADVPKILLAHTPEVIGWALPHKFDLMLFGHTHGGQVSLGNYRFMSHAYRYISGKYQDGISKIIVSNGIGQWFPARLAVPQQLHIIDIVPAFCKQPE